MNIANKLYSSRTLKELQTIPKKEGITTGIQKIDEHFGFPAGFYVIAGNAGTGKGWFALWLSRVFYQNHTKSSVFFSLEMPEFAVRKRILQAWSDLTYSEYLNGGNTTPAIEMLTDDMFVTETFYDDNQAKQTPENFEALFKEYYALGYRAFHFDHLHELAGATGTGNFDVTEAWASIFQKISKTHPDAWLFIYVQPNSQSAKKKYLKKTDMLGSKAITFKCDYFLSLNRLESKQEDGVIQLEDDNREVGLYIDKTRYTEKVHIAFKLIFEHTGNFSDSITNWL